MAPADGLLAELASVAEHQASAWFVAIKDVPIGPMKREEIQRKIQLGAIGGSSLAWGEGMPDWRPLHQIAALADLLRASAAPRTGTTPAPPRPPQPPPAAAMKQEGASDLLAALRSPRAAAASVRSDLTPPPRRLPSAAASSRASGITGPLPAAAPVSIPTPRTTSDSIFARLPIRRGRFGPLALITTGFAAVFAITLGLGLLGFFREKPDDRREAAGEGERSSAKGGEAAGAGNEAIRKALTGERETQTGEEGAADEETATSKRRRTGRVPKKAPSAEDRALLERMRREGAGEHPVLSKQTRSKGSSSSKAAQGLTERQMRRVVTRERPGIQRCYERAMRGMRNQEDLRVMLTVNIGPSGSVTRVSVGGATRRGTPLGDCIYQTARRWRFPSAGAASVLESPFLLTPGR